MASTLEDVLRRRRALNASLQHQSYNIALYKASAGLYRNLGFPDLAVGDAYKALLLVDELLDDTGEYHAQAYEANLLHLRTSRTIAEHATVWRQEMLCCIAQCLCVIGCLESAFETFNKLNAPSEAEEPELRPEEYEATRSLLYAKAEEWARSQDLHWDPFSHDVRNLPNTGLVRREVYPWNAHEADRNSPAALQLLNGQMSSVAPKLEVRLTVLPALATTAPTGTVTQLGVFAKEDVAPGEEILCERSLLTANSRVREPLCDACSAALPDLSHGSTAVACPECGDDAVFCGELCLQLATDSYHAAVCGADTETIAKEVAPKEAADALYTQLLFRAIAMAQTQEIHALDLMEVKYIWGDFTPYDAAAASNLQGDELFLASERTLPFSFDAQVVQPLHFLEKVDINPFTAEHGTSEVWVFNTLLAKFRGTASARISPRDGRPEVAAVHPLWCLANHSCDPNVTWEWAGEIRFNAKRDRAKWRPPAATAEDELSEKKAVQHREAGLRVGEEVLNHYVDIDLSVKERREWGAGALGGACQCDRCKFEAGEA